MNKENLILICLALSIVLSILTLGLNFKDYLIEAKPIVSYNSDCKNLSLFETSNCLKEELSNFYKYNLSNVGKKLTLEELKANGGVCEHYTDWYKDNLIGLGYVMLDDDELRTVRAKDENYVSTHRISISKDTNHIYAVASNYEGYCVLDQLNIECLKFEK